MESGYATLHRLSKLVIYGTTQSVYLRHCRGKWTLCIATEPRMTTTKVLSDFKKSCAAAGLLYKNSSHTFKCY